MRYRRPIALCCAAALSLQTACYSYAPVQSTVPQPAKQTGVVINDRGRVLLGERVGVSVDRIDGQVISVDSTNLVLDVYKVTDLRGNSSTWTGERVTIPREAILGFRERSFSTVRTVALVGIVVLAIVATVSTSLDVFGDGKSDPGTDPPGQSTRTGRPLVPSSIR